MAMPRNPFMQLRHLHKNIARFDHAARPSPTHKNLTSRKTPRPIPLALPTHLPVQSPVLRASYNGHYLSFPS
ncbi:hypothetical protein BGLA2_990108 [Burkholderia gladioli]|nr:hypothetical protein BGLA2_990108 [Burkholderia gladioli]